MHLDVQDLRNFYYRSALGRSAQASLRGRMLELWPEAKGQTVVGFGFAAPGRQTGKNDHEPGDLPYIV